MTSYRLKIENFVPFAHNRHSISVSILQYPKFDSNIAESLTMNNFVSDLRYPFALWNGSAFCGKHCIKMMNIGSFCGPSFMEV